MEKVFKIGIWINEDDFPETGGGFSYTERLINSINQREFDRRIEILFVGFNLKGKFNKKTVSLPFKESYWERKRVNFYHRFFSISLERKDIVKNYNEAKAILKHHDIQLIFYTNPFIALDNYPYICINWDLGHKSTFSFPELTMNGEFLKRDAYFNKVLNEALIICCESTRGKQELVQYSRINPERIKILPMFPGKIVDHDVISEEPEWISSTDSFFIYPAQFWAHKNHYHLLNGLRLFREKPPYAAHKLVLTGSDKGNMAYIKNLVNTYGLKDVVVIPGFVKEEELKWLYKNAVGLVFPSFLGPTNMPLLEALNIGCPIACSNLPGHIELLGDSAVYFDPQKDKEIAEAMISLTNVNLKTEKTATSNLNNELQILEDIFIESIAIRRTWGQFDKIK